MHVENLTFELELDNIQPQTYQKLRDGKKEKTNMFLSLK
jgi:hypothetical protein